MEKLNVSALIRESRQKLEGKDTHRLAVIHAGVTVAVGLVITLLQYVIAEGIGNTSGLSGMGTRSILQTMQTALQWANMILVPFWNLGFVYVAMQWARDRQANKRDLLAGFRSFGPYLRLMLLQLVLALAILVLCANISSVFYMLTPAAGKLSDLTAGMDMEQAYEYMYTIDAAQQTELLQLMVPMFIIWGVMSAVLMIPLFYRFRLAQYAILNQPGTKALPAMIISATLLRRRCWQFLKLDLRLWWYYGLQILCMLLCYADLLLPALGVTLPIGSDAAYLLTYVIYLAALFGVEVCFRPRVETAYAAAYDTLVAMGPAQKKNAPVKPQNMPWDAQ